MAVIEKRIGKDGQVSYRAKVRIHPYPSRSATFSRKTEARDWARDTEAAIKQGKYFKTAEAKNHTLSETIDRYKRDVLPSRKSDRTKVGMHLDWWKKHLGAYTLADLTAPLLTEYRDKLSRKKNAKVSEPEKAETISPATVNRYIASLSIVLSHAVEWGWLEDNPLRNIRKMKESRGRVRFLDEKEKKALLNACRNSRSPHLYPIVLLALSTGARLGELLNLSWKDIDLNQTNKNGIKYGMMRLENTKNGERRSVPVTGVAYEELCKRKQAKSINARYVFPSKDGSKPTDMRDAWDIAVKKAGLEDFRFHDLRHTAASYLAMNGATLYEISAILGHKTLAMVKRYAHLTDDHPVELLDRMTSKHFDTDHGDEPDAANQQ